jgi:hypothetical protein
MDVARQLVTLAAMPMSCRLSLGHQQARAAHQRVVGRLTERPERERHPAPGRPWGVENEEPSVRALVSASAPSHIRAGASLGERVGGTWRA